MKDRWMVAWYNIAPGEFFGTDRPQYPPQHGYPVYCEPLPQFDRKSWRSVCGDNLVIDSENLMVDHSQAQIRIIWKEVT